jgi:hypothetical protein
MNVLEEARYRIRNQQWESDRKARRAREFEAALQKLEDAELRASHPDNENRILDLERIRDQKREVLAIMDEEFKLAEQYQQIADS